MSRAAKRAQQGSYLWRLSEHPLPERDGRERALVARKPGSWAGVPSAATDREAAAAR